MSTKLKTKSLILSLSVFLLLCTSAHADIDNEQSKMKAIIVAGGGPYTGNHIWEETKFCTNTAYKALIAQGYTKNNIYYMIDEDVDADNDGLLNDVDVAVTSDNLYYAVNTWAADASKILLYMVGHGGDGTFMLNKTELFFKAADLDSWLDTLQETMIGEVIVVYDAPYSGSFIPLLIAPSGKKRIVITSSQADELAWFGLEGKLSFSYQFWTSVWIKANLYEPYINAKNTMRDYQASMLDGDGDGISGSVNDFDIAKNIVIGRGRSVNNPSLIVTTGSANIITKTAATLNGTVMPSDEEGICYFEYGKTINYGNSTTKQIVPERSGDAALTITANLTDLTENTIYHFRLVAHNSAGVSYGKDQIFGTSFMKAIIVAGGGPYTGNNIWDATKRCANFAYKVLLSQGYTHETIYYLSDELVDIDDDGIPEVDAASSSANLSYAINTWAADASELLVYIVGDGGDGTFFLNKTEWRLKATDLDNWLDNLQEMINGKVIFLYDACNSGSFIPLLIPPSGKQRIVITSSQSDEPAFFVSGGMLSFSYQFWAACFINNNLYDAYLLAGNIMRSSFKQYADIEADGNGIGSQDSDKMIVKDTLIGINQSILDIVTTDSASNIAETTATLNGTVLHNGEKTTCYFEYGMTSNYGNSTAKQYIGGGTVAASSRSEIFNDTITANLTGLMRSTIYHFRLVVEDSSGTIYGNDKLFQTKNDQKAIIVLGGKFTGNTIWEETQLCANFAYKVLLSQGYTRENIYYLSDEAVDVDKDGLNDVDGAAASADFSYAVNEWALDASELFIYMVDHGGNGTFTLSKTEKYWDCKYFRERAAL